MRFKNLGKVLVWNSRKSHNCCLLLLLPLLGFFVLWTCVVFHESVFPYGSFPTKTRLSSVFILKSDSFGSVCYDLRCVLFNIFRIYFIYMIFFNVPTYIKKTSFSFFDMYHKIPNIFLFDYGIISQYVFHYNENIFMISYRHTYNISISFRFVFTLVKCQILLYMWVKHNLNVYNTIDHNTLSKFVKLHILLFRNQNIKTYNLFRLQISISKFS